ncbi:hypothetical protein AQJ27_24015 [Streptomyces olivochromogenes]|uniref:EamA domain-containing protein n=1 Tax=Streptomyces olivochromogenes TaxID=1963 RepID=A0A250VDT3_STROL|nr:hypothetical protein AQJ27_24015 [Streptomyces olivochromogenes]GAX52196.1 hypothetical protein SO3561_03706 [Streptomyces olivochromogenes]
MSARTSSDTGRRGEPGWYESEAGQDAAVHWCDACGQPWLEDSAGWLLPLPPGEEPITSSGCLADGGRPAIHVRHRSLDKAWPFLTSYAEDRPLLGRPWRTGADAEEWTGLLFLSVLCTLFAFFVQMWAVRRTSPFRVSLLVGTEPLCAAAAGIALGGERLGALGLAGGALVPAGTAWKPRGRRAAG